jgi:hypothetical protein
MPDLFRDDEPEALTPDEFCTRAFSRCSNWPDRAGQLGLAQGLKLASDRYQVTQEALIARCKELSAFCPTDYDLLRVAAEMWEAGRRAAVTDQQREWRDKYGPTRKFDMAAEHARITAESAAYRDRFREMEQWLQQECKRLHRRAQDFGAGEWLQMQVAAQDRFGIPVRREQRAELEWHGLTPEVLR